MPIASDIVFYLDLVNGSDAARASFTATQTGPGQTLFTTAAPHGLVPGAVVDFTTGWTNGATSHKVIATPSPTVFEVDGSIGLFEVYGTGTVVPRGGSSWADAWKTFTSGATAARTATGSAAYTAYIRVAESAKNSLGNITLGGGNNVVDLGAGRGHGVDWYVIDQCDTAWVAVNSATVTTSPTRVGGTASLSVQRSSAVANTRYAYRTITPVDLSAYAGLSLYTRCSSVTAQTSWRLCLCTDDFGINIAYSIELNGIPVVNTFYKTINVPVGIDSLAGTIRSIALYSGSTAPPSGTLLLDNIIAFKNGQMHHQTPLLVDASTQHSTWSNYMLDIAVFDENSTVVLAGGADPTAPATQSAWPVINVEPYPVSYAHSPVIQRLATTTTNFAGFTVNSTTNPVVIEGGYNTTTNTRTGTTIVSSQAISGHGQVFAGSISATAFPPEISGFSLAYVGRAYQPTNTGQGNVRSFKFQFDNIHASKLFPVIIRTGNYSPLLSLTVNRMSAYTASTQERVVLDAAGAFTLDLTFYFVAHSGTLLACGANQTINFNSIYVGSYGTAGFANATQGGTIYINRGSVSGGYLGPDIMGGTQTTYQVSFGGRIFASRTRNVSTVTMPSTSTAGYLPSSIMLHKFNGGASRWYLEGGIILTEEPNSRPGGSGNQWVTTSFPQTASSVSASEAVRVPLATFACNAGSPVTVRSWVCATMAGGASQPIIGLLVPGNSPCFSGPPESAAYTDRSVSAPLLVSGQWYELALTFTPDAQGVFSVFLYLVRLTSVGTVTATFGSCSMSQT